MATEPAKTGEDDKAFAKFGDTLEKVFSAIDALCSRMDEIDEKADKARKDAEETAGEREKAMKDELETLKSHVNLQPEDRSGYGEAQARADAVYRLTGKQAPPPMAGERCSIIAGAYSAPLQDKFAGVLENRPAQSELRTLSTRLRVVSSPTPPPPRGTFQRSPPARCARSSAATPPAARSPNGTAPGWRLSPFRRSRCAACGPSLWPEESEILNRRASSGRPAALPARSLERSSWAPGAVAGDCGGL